MWQLYDDFGFLTNYDIEMRDCVHAAGGVQRFLIAGRTRGEEIRR